MFTIRGCSPKRGEIYSCTHVPELQCTHIKTVSSLLIKRTHQVTEPFSTSFLLYFVIFFYTGVKYIFLIVHHSSSTHSSRLISQISLTFAF